MIYYKSKSRNFLYTGDRMEDDPIASEEEVTAYFSQFNNYITKRIAEYPDYREFLDAQVKINSGDAELVAEGQQQLEKYTQSCLEIKNKYPKA